MVRNAIDNYSAEHPGVMPGADGKELTFKTDIAAYLRGQDFPTCPVAAKNNAVRMMPGSGPVASSISGTSEATHSWVYQFETGEFYINSKATANDGVTTTTFDDTKKKRLVFVFPFQSKENGGRSSSDADPNRGHLSDGRTSVSCGIWEVRPPVRLTLPSRSAERGIADKPCLRIHLGRAGTARWPVIDASPS